MVLNSSDKTLYVHNVSEVQCTHTRRVVNVQFAWRRIWDVNDVISDGCNDDGCFWLFVGRRAGVVCPRVNGNICWSWP